MPDRILRRFAALFFMALVACGGPQSDVSADEVASDEALEVGASRQLADGWYEVRPEPGLSLQLRDGWSANRAEDGKGPIVFTGPGDARVMVWPMFVSSESGSPPPEAVLMDFANRAGADFAWSEPSRFGQNGVRMFANGEDTVAQASFVYTESEAGLAGFWYLTTAELDEYAGLQPVFAQLMEGVRIYGPETGPSATSQEPPPMQYVTWSEPNEGAYTAQVPEGWNVSGGIVRPDPLRLLDVVEMSSDDGNIYAFSSDPTLPVFKTITQMERQLGLSEGMQNGAAILMPYIPAAEYLPNYLQNRFGSRCGEITIEDVQDQRDIAAQYNEQLAASTAPGSYMNVDVGLAHFRCGADQVGMVQMGTFITGTYDQYGTEGFGIWQVSGVAGFISPPSRAQEATSAVLTMLTDRKVNAQWQRANQQMVSQIQAMSRETANQLSAQIAGRYSPASSGGSGTSSASSTSDDLGRQWQNSIMDQTDVVDPSTGTAYKVDSGSNYYWINQQGTAIAGTNAPSQPTTDFNQMIELP